MIKRLTTLFYALVVIGWVASSPSYGQSDPTGQRRVTGAYAITNATVITQPGKQLTGATILLRNGLIEGVGSNLAIPQDARLIKGDSLFVYAGFIDMGSEAGVGKPEDPQKPDNMDPSDPPNNVAGITPEYQVLNYWNPADGSIADWRKAGFTMAQLLPRGQMLPGNTALVVYGDHSSSNVIDESTGIYAQFETARGVYPGTTLGLMAKYRELYKNAELKNKHNTLFASNANGISRPEKDKTLEAFYPVINKQIPIVFEAEDELEIRRVLKLQKELGYDLVITGIQEGSSLAADLKAANAKVVLTLALPEDKASKANMDEATEEAKQAHQRVVEAYQHVLAEAGNFEKAGMAFGFATKGAKKDEVLKNIQLMIKNGLTEEGALAALTTNPASLLGISNFAGTIEKGKLANLVLSTAPIFGEDAQIKYVLADGYLHEYEETKSSKASGKAAELVGKWDYTAQTPGGSSKGEIRFSQEAGNLKGEIDVDNPSGGGILTRELEDISYDGKKLSFSFSITAEGQELIVNTKGNVDGNSFNGSISIRGMGDFSLTATKVPDSKF